MNSSMQSIMPFLLAVRSANKNVYIFVIEQTSINPFKTGAFLNAGVHLAGLSANYHITFFSVDNGKWSSSDNILVSNFLKSNGYENDAIGAAELNCTQKSFDGYHDIFPVHSKDNTYSKQWFHYIVTIERDSVLNLDFIPMELNIIL